MRRFPFLWRYAIRETLYRPLRAMLTLIGIVMAVAALMATQLGSAATRQGYVGMYRSLAGRAELEVVPAGGAGTMPASLEVLRQIRGVRLAVPVVQVPTALLTTTGPQPLLILGVDRQRDGQVREVSLEQGTDQGAMLESSFAARHGVEIGESVRLMTPTGPARVRVTGLLRASGPARFNGGAVAVLPLELAQALLMKPGEVTGVQCVLDPGADRQALREEIEARLPDVLVQTPESPGRLAGEFLLTTEQMLHSLSAIALVAGGLVVLNTFLMSVRERKKQTALLRAVGMTSSQSAGLILRQAMLLGMTGVLLGMALGTALSVPLIATSEWFLGIALPRFWPSLPLVLVVGLVGLGMTLLACWIPARQVSRLSVQEALGRGEAATERAGMSGLIVSGIVILGMVGGYVGGVIGRWIPQGVAVPLMPLFAGAALIGCACLLLVVLPGFLRALRLGGDWLGGMEERLTVRQLSRDRARTGLTVGVLFAAVAACVSFGLSYLVNLRDVERWYQTTIDVDYLVRAVPPDAALVVTPAVLPRGSFEEIRQLPGIERVERFRFQATRLKDRPVMCIVREYPRQGPLPLYLHEGNPRKVQEALQQGEIVMANALAQRLGVGVGDKVEMRGQQGPQTVRIAGLTNEYTAGGQVVYMGWEAVQRLFGLELAHGLFVQAAGSDKEEVGRRLREYGEKRELLLQTKGDFAAMIGRVTGGVQGFLVGMLVLIFGVAGMGVVNTLSTNVLEQTRELGVLRALGMKRQQVQRLIWGQALMLSVISCVAGAPVGILLAYLMNRCTPRLTGHVIAFEVYPGFVLLCVLMVTLLALLSAWIPARRAAHLRVIEVLRND